MALITKSQSILDIMPKGASAYHLSPYNKQDASMTKLYIIFDPKKI
jgi:hypothetical protein